MLLSRGRGHNLKQNQGFRTGKATFEVQEPNGPLFKFTLTIVKGRLQGYESLHGDFVNAVCDEKVPPVFARAASIVLHDDL
jgi:hypothetical protein